MHWRVKFVLVAMFLCTVDLASAKEAQYPEFSLGQQRPVVHVLVEPPSFWRGIYRAASDTAVEFSDFLGDLGEGMSYGYRKDLPENPEFRSQTYHGLLHQPVRTTINFIITPVTEFEKTVLAKDEEEFSYHLTCALLSSVPYVDLMDKFFRFGPFGKPYFAPSSVVSTEGMIKESVGSTTRMSQWSVVTGKVSEIMDSCTRTRLPKIVDEIVNAQLPIRKIVPGTFEIWISDTRTLCQQAQWATKSIKYPYSYKFAHRGGRGAPIIGVQRFRVTGTIDNYIVEAVYPGPDGIEVLVPLPD